jgi:AraC-like DNA-binding protein
MLLAALGTNLNDLLDRLRHYLALKYIRESDLSLVGVAFVVGYANQPAFNLAFKPLDQQSIQRSLSIL